MIYRIANLMSAMIVYFLAGFGQAAKRTGWRHELADGGGKRIETGDGSRRITGSIAGVARVLEIRRQPHGLEVIFSRGRFASWIAGDLVKFDWPGDGGNGTSTPIFNTFTESLARRFVASSFHFVLLPRVLAGGRVETPILQKGDLVQFKLLATNMDGTEGVAEELEPA